MEKLLKEDQQGFKLRKGNFKHQKHTTIFDGTLIFSILTKRELNIICNDKFTPLYNLILKF